MQRFLGDEARRRSWIEALDLKDVVTKDHYHICSWHFPNANARNAPLLSLGKLFASRRKN